MAQARADGAKCYFDCALAAIEPDGFTARVVIGADGPRSRAGRAIAQVNHELRAARQIKVSLHAAHDAMDIFLSATYPGGGAIDFDAKQPGSALVFNRATLGITSLTDLAREICAAATSGLSYSITIPGRNRAGVVRSPRCCTSTDHGRTGSAKSCSPAISSLHRHA